MYKKILLPTDGSEYAVREVERANKLLAEGGEIIILGVVIEIRKTEPIRKLSKKLKLM